MKREWGLLFWAQWLAVNVLSWAVLWAILLAVLGLENRAEGWPAAAVYGVASGVVVAVALLIGVVVLLPQRAVLRRAVSLPRNWTRATLAGLAAGFAAALATLLAATLIEAFQYVQAVMLVGLVLAGGVNALVQWRVIDRDLPRTGWLVAANVVNLGCGGLLTLLLVLIPLALAAWNLGDTAAGPLAYLQTYSLIGAVGGAIGGLLAGAIAAPFLSRFRAGQLLPAG